MIAQPVLKTTVADISRMFLVNMRFALATDLLTLLIIISSQLTDDKKVTKRSESFFSSIKNDLCSLCRDRNFCSTVAISHSESLNCVHT